MPKRRIRVRCVGDDGIVAINVETEQRSVISFKTLTQRWVKVKEANS